MSFQPAVNAEDFEYIGNPPHVLTEAARRETGHVHEDTTDVSCKQLTKSDEAHCVRFATDTVVKVVRDGVTTSVSIDGVTKVPTGPRALQSSAATSGEEYFEATIPEAATEVGPTVQDMRETDLLREVEKEYVIGDHAGYHRTAAGLKNCPRSYG